MTPGCSSGRSEQARSAENQAWEAGGGGVRGTMRLVRLLAASLPAINDGLLDAAHAGADLILLSQVSMLGGYDIARGLGIPSAGVFVVPIHPTLDFPPAVGLPSMGRTLNRLAGNILHRNGSQPFAKAIAHTQDAVGRPRRGPGALIAEQDRDGWPVLYGISPSVIPRPADWRPGIEVCGYLWPALPREWQPDPALLAFLDAGEPPVFLGFGSLGAAHGERLSQIVRDAVRLAGVRAVVQAGWAGLAATADRTLTIGPVPHAWLFPRTSLVVHHAGAGTTGAALRAGVPQLPLPVAGDQPFWAGRARQLGVAPGALPFQRLTAQRLASAITTALADEHARRRAQHLAGRIATEDGASRIVEALGALLRP